MSCTGLRESHDVFELDVLLQLEHLRIREGRILPAREEITADYEPGSLAEVTQHDGSVIRLRKIAPDYDPTDRLKAMNYLQHRAAAGEVVTGLLYIDPQAEDLHTHLNTVEAPLNQLGNRELCPGTVALERINASLR